MVGTSLPVTPVRRQIIFTEPMPDLAPVVPFTSAARSRRKRNSRHGRHAGKHIIAAARAIYTAPSPTN
jgi:hypothetical protein